MTQISVTVITKNEAGNIVPCLTSVDWADEIIVVDGFSTDGTDRMARDLGARLFQEPWKGFAAQKNSAVQKARGPWILSLDADERVTEPLREEIRAVLTKDPRCEGYLIPRKNFFCGRFIRHGGWHPDLNLRLFLKVSGRFEDRPVHERAVVNGAVGRLHNPMEHYTYHTVDDYLERLKRYSTLAALQLAQKGRRPGWRHVIFRPPFTFVRMYLLQLGFLDGLAGFFLACSYAYYTLLKYVKLQRPDWDRGSRQQEPPDPDRRADRPAA